MSNQANLLQLLRRIPPKWALAIIGCILLYWLGQPVLNRTFGWNLPSLAQMLGDAAPQPESSGEKSPTAPTSPPQPEKSSGASKSPVAEKDVAAKAKIDAASTKKSNEKSVAKTKSIETEYDFLKEIGRDRFQSPAGLIYARGSEEGHRLKHIAKHLEDQPTRPGSHGVFNGDLLQALRWIDEGYQKAKKGDRNARTFQEDDRTKYVITFDKPIGYVGGSDGKRKGNPPAKRLTIIVSDQNVITAFPF